ncbi:cell division protein FtsZ [Agrobacterium larrymoorei]|uniref:Cell division protein FtsZ n=1 Tax=Agrobacterium larrymoorei TaxID=160699 RepID=A0AAJ2BGU1_9HYPH|nr:cell division protein FtsZ [Agrobacterium larrymoorei]MDQ1186460.1 cell division protein FtsZ [Agrobacterium larrymoorei]MDR6102681.1 cell division protein FtsZ [Agrobacterium larrymoorei]
MTIQLQKPDITELKPRITVFGVGGGGGNAVNNMITAGLQGVDFVVANTDAQALTMTKADRVIQLGVNVTEGLGAGSQPEVGRAAAEECIDEIIDHLNGTHMCFVTAGMGGGTGTGAAPVVAQAARNKGILTVGVVTKPFHFEGGRRMRLAEQGIEELQKSVDTLIVIPNQNLFRIANDKTTFADAFAMADQVLYSGVACITDLMVKEGLINLDFADVRSVMREMGRAMMGTGEASGEGRAMQAAEAAIANPLLDETSMKGAQGLLISITGGRDLTLFEVDEAATRIREEVDPDANIILGATFDEALEGLIRVSVVATGIDRVPGQMEKNIAEMRAAAAAAAKPVIRPSAAVASAPAAVQPAPVMQAPKSVDPIAQTIRAAEVDMERELALAAAEQQLRQAQAEAEFRPQSKLFASAPAEAPVVARPAAPVQAAPAPVYHAPEQVAAPAPRMAQPQAQVYHEPAPVARQPEPVRMPKVEDFPPVVKAEMDHRAQVAHAAPEERGPMGLLKRITNSLGRRDEEEAVPSDMMDAPSLAPQQRRPMSPEASMYAPRRGNLDDHGRQSPASASHHEDDQLEIPAFLRRQSN